MLKHHKGPKEATIQRFKGKFTGNLRVWIIILDGVKQGETRVKRWNHGSPNR